MASTSGNNVKQRYNIAISPFGKEIVIFDYVSHILKTWRFTQDMIAIPTNFECELREDIGIKTEEINWSLAISDADSDGNTLIALSSMKILNSIQINSTRIVSTSGNKVWHKIKNFYGFLQFFQGNMILISNHLGIVRGLCIDNKSDIDDLTNLYNNNYTSSKRRLKLKNVNVYEKYWKPIYIIEKPSYMDNDKRKSKSKYARYYEICFDRKIDKPLFIYQDLYYPRTFNKQFKKHIINYHEQSESYDKEEKKFYEIFGYPSDFIKNLEILNEEEQLNFIKNCVICGKLIILNEENNIEMYNLLSKNIDMLYHHSDFQTKLTNNIFAISKNAKLLAVTISNDSIALYLNENSLNIANKKFTSNSIISRKIIYMTFFNDDNKLLLLLKKEDKEDKILIIWNIFEDSEKIYSIDEKVQIMDLFGIIAFINNSGNIQLLDEKNLREFEIKNNDETRQELLKLSESITRNYNKREKRIMDNNIFDIEPWLDSDHYQISYWLDYSKTLRISYGFYTIQIWENDELIYIWSDYNIDNYNLSNKILTQYIELLDISQDDNGNITSKFRCIDVEHELQISKLVNNEFLTKDHAIGAYNSLIFFSKLKLTNISYKLKIDELIEQTKRIIYNIIIKKPNLWRLLDVRYNLMENLIYNQSNDIIKFILNSTEETKKNAKRNQKLHIPQLYDWNGNIRSNHELLIALKENNIEVIQQITNYYSCNAIENTGWMITLTRALPELNKKLPEYVIKLFKKPVFSQKQMHLKKSRIKSILATNPSYNIFIVDTRLPSLTKKEYQNQSFSLRDSEHSNDYLNDNIKIRMIPLPDFNKFAEISGIKQIGCSPFFDLMSERHSNLIYNNSTIETIINFYWNTHIFRITLPKLILYVIYFIGINVHLLLFSFYPIYRNISKHSNIGGTLASLQSLKFFNFMGSETKRTFYYYIFHSFSYALLIITLYLFDEFSDLNIVVILVTFTMLILWVEFFLFLRIIPGIKPQSDEYQFSNITIQQKIDSPNFFETLEMVYLWLFGNWDDVKNWDYIPIKILALLASFFIVIIMQNIFVALMAEDISTARNYSVIASLKSKTDYIIQAQYQNYYYLRNFGSYFYLSTESSFNFRFYHLTTFNSTYNRHIFYTVNRDNIKNWITIDDDTTSNDSEFSGNINELIEKISDRQLFLENEVHKLNEKFDKLLVLLSKKQ
ncbi:10589_t:CDS:2 [Rhizophagus irregularis]|nr:10589_t:CDS:2 [Rhizophagus irregularis]